MLNIGDYSFPSYKASSIARHFIWSEIAQNAEFDAEYLDNAVSVLNETYAPISGKFSVVIGGILAF